TRTSWGRGGRSTTATPPPDPGARSSPARPWYRARVLLDVELPPWAPALATETRGRLVQQAERELLLRSLPAAFTYPVLIGAVSAATSLDERLPVAVWGALGATIALGALRVAAVVQARRRGHP